MLGYMTAREALVNGFTHHGKYFGIPLWMGAIDSEAPMVATKWLPMEYLMSLFHHIEQILAALLYPDAEPVFQFLVGAPIEQAK